MEDEYDHPEHYKAQGEFSIRIDQSGNPGQDYGVEVRSLRNIKRLHITTGYYGKGITVSLSYKGLGDLITALTFAHKDMIGEIDYDKIAENTQG